MRKTLAYSLFGTDPRYLANIPYLLVANSVIYSDFKMKFYVHRSSTEVPSFVYLKEANELFDSVEVVITDEAPIATKPTLWRMRPLWEDDIDYLFCRDLDYTINELERKAVEYFIQQNQCIIHGIRSYALHSVPLMAGLCGFRVGKVRKKLRGHNIHSYADYCKYGEDNIEYCSDWRWGCDQALLRDLFHATHLYPLVLDCPQESARLIIEGFDGVLCKPSQYAGISLPNCDKTVLAYSDTLTSYAGQAYCITTDEFEKVLSLIDNDMSKLVQNIHGRFVNG